MIKSQNIFLIGSMGSGKTTVGRSLAKELQLPFYDSDKEIELQTGADIGWIFDREGEKGFRKREERVIADLTLLQGIILATGGGVILSSQNRTLLAARGFVVYLYVSIEQQLSRIAHAKDRPLLVGEATLKENLEKLYKERELLYRELADLIISTDHLTPWAIAQDIIAKINLPFIKDDNSD